MLKGNNSQVRTEVQSAKQKALEAVSGSSGGVQALGGGITPCPVNKD